MKQFKYPLNIQMFGEDPSDPADPAGTPPADPAEPKSLQDILGSDPRLKAEYDEAMRIHQMQVDAAADAKVKSKLDESKRLEAMNEQERQDELLRLREEGIAKREREIELRELQSTAKSMFVEAKLPETLMAHIDYTNADTVKTSFEALKKAFEDSVTDRVRTVAQQTPTPPGGSAGNGKVTDPTIARLSKRYGLDIK